MEPDLQLSQASNAQLRRDALTLNPSACKVAGLLYYCAAYRDSGDPRDRPATSPVDSDRDVH
jgi:hypothetical protein